MYNRIVNIYKDNFLFISYLLVESLNPQIQLISKINSPFTFNVIFSIASLSPNQMFQFWTFYPNGKAIGNTSFSSNDKGNASNPQGINEIMSGFSSSNVLPNGLYIFGFNMGNFVVTKKLYFDEWNDSPLPKHYIKLDIRFKKETILILDEIGDIPWGTDAKASGHLWYKNVNIEKEPQISPNGASWFIGRKIYFTGTGKFPKSVETDAFSKFLEKFEVENNPEQNCTLQAHYDGDNKYFDECHSNIVYYNIITHRTALTVKIDTLKLNPFNKDILRDKITLEANQFFRIKGKLIDIDYNIGIKNQKINFETNIPNNILYTETEEDGSFQIDNLQVPSKIAKYYIKSIFSATDLYDNTKSNILEFDVIERKLYDNKIMFLPEDNKSQKPTKKVFLSYAKEDIEQAYRIYHYLIKSDIDVWFDKESLLPGQKWEYEIEKQIKERDFIILLLSSISVNKRGYIQKEYKLTLDVLETIPEGQIYAIPLRLDNCDIPYQFKKYHYRDLFPDLEKNLKIIIDRIIKA